MGSTPESKAGFTLIEMSIVLAILALMIGTVLTGQKMLRQARVDSIMIDVKMYESAIGQFKDKYGDLPGDMANATSYWGAANADATTCQTTVGTGTQTCNGDGNGHIGEFPNVNNFEEWRAWQQLANAGMLEGNYSGVAGPNTYRQAVPGTNVPLSKLGTNIGHTLVYWGSYTDGLDWTPPPFRYCHMIMFGTPHGNLFETYATALTPSEAFSIDSKFDDGLPATGKIQTVSHSVLPDCTTSTSSLTATYNLLFASTACGLMFLMPF
jgi:prepilin-type N-terminal cleavage/methylation domain-containing protein